LVLINQLEKLKKNSLVRDSKTGRFVKFGKWTKMKLWK
jgi:hypothetical protein